MFEDRINAGELLGAKLSFCKESDSLLVAIPRGGVVVGKAISEMLNIPLSLVLTRKIGAPGQSELAIGAVASGGIIVRDEKLISDLSVSEKYIKNEIKKERKVMALRQKKYGKCTVNLRGKQAILVDDGIATGATVKAAIAYLRERGVSKLILAVPVAPKDAVEELKPLVDKIVVLDTPDDFSSVGQFYRYFPQVTDEEVVKLLCQI